MGIFHFFDRLFGKTQSDELTNEEENTMKYLIVGLGNIGAEYEGTRHNIGFKVADRLADSLDTTFADRRYGFVAKGRVKNAELIILKPSTYMNLSGNAVRYWMQQEKIPLERVLIICDDLSLPFGKLRLRQGGSDGGHNGLKHITQVVGTQQFARLKFGLGNDFPRGTQIDFVLGKFTDEELQTMSGRVDLATDAAKTFCLAGIVIAMNQYNNK